MRSFCFVGSIVCAAFGVLGCGGDDVTSGPADGGHEGGTGSDANVPGDASPDVALDAALADGGDGGGDASPGPSWLLLSYGTSTSELVAFNLGTNQVDGRLAYAGAYGTTSTQGSDPYVLEQAADIVAKLDRNKPWLVDSSWDVSLGDKDAGLLNSDPDGVVVPSGTKAYVLRYAQNQIAIVDPSQPADAGSPKATIDLGALVQAADTDGVVEMTAGVYVASRHRLYVVLGNIDRNTIQPPSYDLFCTATTSSVIAIDTNTDLVVDLGGSAPGGGIPLTQFDPIFGGVQYDAAADRLLVFNAGCNAAPIGDAGPGALTKRGVEQVTFADGKTKALLDASSSGFPTGFVYVDATHAVLGFDAFGGETRAWDPTSPTLGAVIPNAPDYFVYDGVGNLLGTRSDAIDGGSVIDVVSVRIADGKTTTLATAPFTKPGGFVSGVDLWPHP